MSKLIREKLLALAAATQQGSSVSINLFQRLDRLNHKLVVINLIIGLPNNDAPTAASTANETIFSPILANWHSAKIPAVHCTSFAESSAASAKNGSLSFKSCHQPGRKE